MSTVTEVHESETQDQVAPVQASAGQTAPLAVFEVPIFADLLLEPSGFQRRRRGVASIVSFSLQCVFLGIALIVPLMFTEALPRQQLLTFLTAPPPPPPPPPPAAAAPAVKVLRQQSDLLNGQLRSPSRIPQKVQMIREEEAPPLSAATGGVVGGVPGGIPGGQLGGVIGGIISSASKTAVVPKLAVAPPRRVRISQGVTKGMLLQKVEPKYPTIAVTARIQGTVVLNAIISKSGEIENLTVASGHPMLVPAAIDAVRQWRYRPYLLNGEPVEVETTINVTFALSQ